MALAHFLGGLQLGELGRAKTHLFTECVLIGLEQQTQATELRQQMSGEVDSAFSGQSGAQKNCQ